MQQSPIEDIIDELEEYIDRNPDICTFEDWMLREKVD